MQIETLLNKNFNFYQNKKLMENQQNAKRSLSLTLTVLENRDSSFGNSKEIPLSGSTCTCTCTCCCGGGGGDDIVVNEPPVA